jgi:hypothetical protein
MPGLALPFFCVTFFPLVFVFWVSIDQSAWRKVVFLLGDTPLTNTWNFDGVSGAGLIRGSKKVVIFSRIYLN